MNDVCKDMLKDISSDIQASRHTLDLIIDCYNFGSKKPTEDDLAKITSDWQRISELLLHTANELHKATDGISTIAM